MVKTQLRFLLVVFCLGSFTLPRAWAFKSGDIIKPDVRSGVSLRMRSQPTSRSRIKDRLSRNDTLTVIGDARGNWLKVRNQDGVVGYVYSRYTDRVAHAKDDYQATSGSFQLGNVNEWASLLPSPWSSYGSRKAKIPLGQKLEAIAKDPRTGRVKVRFNKDGESFEGWVDAHRLLPAETTAQVNPAPSPAPDLALNPTAEPSAEAAQADIEDNDEDMAFNPFAPPAAAVTPLESISSPGFSETTGSPPPLPVQNPVEAAPMEAPLPEQKPEIERPQTPRSNPEAYAKALTDCAGYGIRNSGKNLCARGVRMALNCAAKKSGISALEGIHCGGSAIDYAGKGCLEKRGFKNDMTKCNTPGVIRVYDGVCSKRNGGRCKKGFSYRTAGDRHGHIEFLGTDNKYHSFYSSRTPVNKSRSLGKRRQLVACYVR